MRYRIDTEKSDSLQSICAVSDKDTKIGATSARLTITAHKADIQYDAATSMADAIVSVAPSISRSDFDALRAHLGDLDMATHKLLAEGTASLADLGIETALPSEVTTGMAQVVYQQRELESTHERQKELEEIKAHGPVKAEHVKGTWLVIVGIALAMVGWLIGKYG